MSEDTSSTDGNGSTAKIRVESVGDKTALSKAESSTQLAERRIRSVGVGVKPPYNPDRLASFLELNETLATGIRKKSRYEVGYGFDIVPHPYIDAEDADETEREVIRDFWRGPTSTWQTSADRSAEPATPEEVKELCRQDYHLVGFIALEVLTNAEGKPVGLAHVPATTVRVRRPQEALGHDQAQHPEDGRFVDNDVAAFASRGYVQVRNGRRRYFGEFGDRYRGLEPEYVENSDGAPTVTYTPTDDDKDPVFVDRESGDVATGSSDALENEPANELIFIKNPNPLEDDYGVPDWVSAMRTISADEAAKDYNREFFQNDTIPRFVIKVTGGELTEESRNDLEAMLDGLREESHRAVILEVEKFQQQLDEDVEIELEPLGQGISEEMDFRQFREKNEHELSKVLEIPPILIGVTETSNRSNSKEQVRDFARNVVQPEQHKFSQRLYETLHQTAFGVDDWTIEYELRGAEQPKEDAAVARQKIQAVRGSLPVNRGLEMIGEEPLPEDHDVDGDTLISEVGQEPTGESGGQTEAARPEYLPAADGKLGSRDWVSVEEKLAVEGGVATKDPIEQQQFDSSNLAEGLFDYAENELYLSFTREDGSNSLYVYVDVPTTEWAGLVNAGSHGSYHYSNIRLSYAYLEVTNHHSRLPEGPAPDAEDVPDDLPSEI